jgi:hypothetical protein
MMSSLPTDRLATGQQRFLGFLLCIWLLPGAVHAAVKVELVIDLRAEIAAGRFIAGRDQIGVRG